MTFTPPTKRTTGQCACVAHPDKMGTPTDLHLSDCPALYPLQPQPGDTPACTCNEAERLRRGDTSPRADAHYSDCPRAKWLDAQRGIAQPGDEPDTLTKLTRFVRESTLHEVEKEQALALISEAAEARKDMESRLDCLRHNFQFETKALRATRAQVAALEANLAAQQETLTALSNKATETLRMGQQQGRVELATELLSEHGLHPTLATRLDEIVRDDAND